MRRYISALLAFVMIFSSFLMFSHLMSGASFADTDVDTGFLEALITAENEPEFRYKPNSNIINQMTPGTGFDDLSKLYMLTGNTVTSGSSGKQSFENGSYSSGAFTVDYEALASHVSAALKILEDKESEMTPAEISRARSIISYAFEQLPLSFRIFVDNAPVWLAGLEHTGVSCAVYAEGLTLSSKGLSGSLPAKPSDNRFTGSSRRIRNDREDFKHYLMLNPEGSDSYIRIKAPSGAKAFRALISIDSVSAKAYTADPSGDKVSVYTVSSGGGETFVSSFYIYPGYENVIDIETGSAAYVLIRFSDLKDPNRNIILGNAAFLTGSANYFDESIYRVPGDINGDTVITQADLSSLYDATVGKTGQILSVHDLNFDRNIDHADIAVLENYLIFLRNVNKINKVDRPEMRIISVGDSIARGYGIGNEGANGTSRDAFGAQFADMIKEQTPFKINFTNYGYDGDRVSDLSNKIKSGYRRINADEKLDSAIKNSDFILISIGGNDMLAALRDGLSKELGITVNDLGNIISELGSADKQKILQVIEQKKISKYIQSTIPEFTEKLKALTDQIRALNPNAIIALTTIPPAEPVCEVKYGIDIPFLGRINYDLFELYSLTVKWTGYYNQAMIDCFAEYGSDRLVIVDSAAKFDSDPELSRTVLPSLLMVNDVIENGTDPSWTFDIHPTKKGHTVMAGCFAEALSGEIEKKNGEYVKPTPVFDKYVYSVGTTPGSVKFSGKNTVSADALEYSVDITELAKHDNLLIKVSCGESPVLRLRSIEFSDPEKAVAFRSGSEALAMYDKNAGIPGKVTVKIVYDVLSNESSKTGVEIEVFEVLNTVSGAKSFSWKNEAELEYTEKEPAVITTEKTATEKPVTDKPATDAPGTDKPLTDAPGTDKPGTNIPVSTDKPVTGGSDPQGTAPTSQPPQTSAPSSDPSSDPPSDPSEKDPLVIGEKKDQTMTYIVIGVSAAAVLAALVVTGVSLKKSKEKKDK